MRPYVAVLSARFRLLLQYRAAAFAGLATQVFWGLIRTMILMAFYENKSVSPPMQWEHVLAYIWFGQAFFAMFPLRPDFDLVDMMRTGNVAYELLRPVDLYGFWYSRAVANRIAPPTLRALPILVIAAIAGWIHWPGFVSAVGGLASLAAAALLGAAIATIMTITIFWTISARGVYTLISMTAYLLSGMIIPLPLFPDSLQPVLNFLPFRGLCDAPFRVLAGHIPPAELPLTLAHQLAWALVLILFGRWLLSRATRRLVVQGG